VLKIKANANWSASQVSGEQGSCHTLVIFISVSLLLDSPPFSHNEGFVSGQRRVVLEIFQIKLAILHTSY